GFNIAGNFYGRQGYPYVQWVRINMGDGFGTQSAVIGPLDRQRHSNVFDADLRLEKVINVKPLQINLSIDVFNVANSATVLQRQGRVGDFSNKANAAGVRIDHIVPNATYNLITETLSPRVVRAGARISF